MRLTLTLFRNPHQLTDEALMERVAWHNDDRAYDELYHRHARRLMGFFFRQVNRDEALAADMVQDAFLKVWASRQTFLPHGSSGKGRSTGDAFQTWMYGIAYNLLKNHYRHISYVQAYEHEERKTAGEEYSDDFDLRMDKAAFGKALQEELRRMPPPTRMLFSLRFEEELSVPQIAAVLGIPEGTVKSRLHTLIHSLKEKLQHYGKL